MDPVVHFEMPAENMQRMRAFYHSAFGWETQQLGEDMGNYVVVSTTATDTTTNRPKTPGAINGGFYQKSDDPFSHQLSMVIAVKNLEESMEKVKAAGGKLHGDVYDIPGIGRLISIVDTEGNHVSLLQPIPNMD